MSPSVMLEDWLLRSGPDHLTVDSEPKSLFRHSPCHTRNPEVVLPGLRWVILVWIFSGGHREVTGMPSARCTDGDPPVHFTLWLWHVMYTLYTRHLHLPFWETSGRPSISPIFPRETWETNQFSFFPTFSPPFHSRNGTEMGMGKWGNGTEMRTEKLAKWGFLKHGG